MRICRVATIPFMFRHHIRSQIEMLVESGHEVHLVCSPSSNFKGGEDEGLPIGSEYFHPIDIPRRLQPLSDLRALISLYRLFREKRFDVVHSITLKAGILSAIAGLAAGISCRLHTFTGQPWMHLSGWMRWASKLCDWLIVRLNTRCYADGFSQVEYLVSQGVAKAGAITVLGQGSIAGVDTVKFASERFNRHKIRASLAIADQEFVVVFLGRVNREKGAAELVTAFETLQRRGFSNIRLVIVGPVELEAEWLPDTTILAIKENTSIMAVGYTETPENYLAIADVLCLPSYREGFPSVVMEAAAMGVPTVATHVTGLVDSVVDGETGILVPVKDPGALSDALCSMICDPDMRQRMGTAALRRAKTVFDSVVVNQLVVDEYGRLKNLG